MNWRGSILSRIKRARPIDNINNGRHLRALRLAHARSAEKLNSALSSASKRHLVNHLWRGLRLDSA